MKISYEVVIIISSLIFILFTVDTNFKTKGLVVLTVNNFSSFSVTSIASVYSM